MTASTRHPARPRLAPTEIAELRSELEGDLRCLTMTAGLSEGGTSLLDARAQVRSRMILSALARMEDRTYGSCLGCGGPIPYTRLIAIPEAAACLKCTTGVQ